MRDSIRGLHPSLQHRLILVAGLLCAAQAHAAFDPPQAVTDGSAKHRLTRNSGSCAAFDSTGRLHLAYWSGGESSTPAAPSAVLHRSWTPGGGWSAETVVDDSFYDTGSGLVRYGGRQPSLAIGADDSVWVAWHDHRHSNPDAPGLGIDNLEVYADRMPFGGSFSNVDTRITATSAGTNGDNGYFPRIVAAPSGVVSIVWYDFNADVTIADIYARHSDASGNFGAPPAIGTMRVTDKDDRGGFISYTVADAAVSPAGVVASVWTSGVGGSAAVRFALVPNPTAELAEEQIAPSCAGYFDPPKIVAAANGDFWVAWTDTSGATRDVKAMRRDATSGLFDAPVSIAQTAAEEYAGDIAVDDLGRLHCAWVEGTGSARTIRYAHVDPTGPTQLDAATLTTSANFWDRPAVVLSPGGLPYVVFEEDTSTTAGAVWMSASSISSAVEGWEAYE